MSDPILITGASRGLGRSAALHLAQRGAAIIGTYNHNQDAAEVVAAEISQAGGQAKMLALDVSEPETFGAFAQTVRQTLTDAFGADHLGALVNNAGTASYQPIGEVTEPDFDRMIAEHIKAPIFLTQALLPLIADGGQVLNLSSGLARFTLPGFAVYGSAKSAVETLTRYMAKELGERRIRVNVLAPGAIATDFGGGQVRDNADTNR